jgi:hypothetical protein
MAPRKPKASSSKPRLTNARYKQIVRELEHLNNKYQGDLERIIPSIGEIIRKARERIKSHSEVPKPGATDLWSLHLSRLWRLVRALQIANPNLNDSAACRLLAREGFWIWAHDPRSIEVEDVHRFVDNPGTLRRQLAQAKQSLRDSPALQDLEQEARCLANDDRIKALVRGKISPEDMRGI